MPALSDDPWAMDDRQRRTLLRLFRDIPEDRREEHRRRAIRHHLLALFAGIDYDHPPTTKEAADQIVALVNEVHGGRDIIAADIGLLPQDDTLVEVDADE